MNGNINIEVAEGGRMVHVLTALHDVSLPDKMVLLHNFCDALNYTDTELELYNALRAAGVLKHEHIRVETGIIKEAMSNED